ncbi:hypothetical protein HS088_TW23G00895 [Tripterygium wilfordii]|uniref:Uncharacterized protein n=1 Tax=Tripterygium wilfordii TaxID=458696 RepID=A0A7J7BWB2_TRIWF|nr:hypothetical protein HS088_TW23G00895 [Tripterygium wilfordii]
MECEERIKAADAGPTNEDGGGGGTILAIGRSRERSDLMVVEFNNGWVDPNRGEKIPHDVAHAARGSSEYYDRVLRNQALDSGLGRFGYVEGEAVGLMLALHRRRRSVVERIGGFDVNGGGRVCVWRGESLFLFINER